MKLQFKNQKFQLEAVKTVPNRLKYHNNYFDESMRPAFN